MDNGDPFSGRIVDIYDNDENAAPYSLHIHHKTVDSLYLFHSTWKEGANVNILVMALKKFNLNSNKNK